MKNAFPRCRDCSHYSELERTCNSIQAYDEPDYINGGVNASVTIAINLRRLSTKCGHFGKWFELREGVVPVITYFGGK